MSEPSAEPALASPAATLPDPKKRLEAERVLGEVLRLLEVPARLETKDASDGGIAVAVHAEAEHAGALGGGKRSNVVDALQFLANKIINRPNQERRWISIGVGAFPEPRGPKPPRPAAIPSPALPAAPTAPTAVGAAPPAAPAPRAPKPPLPPPPAKAGEPDERSLEVPVDVALAAVVKSLAERSGRLGRFYAIHPMKKEDRARVLKAAEGLEGVKVLVEGEGKLRRIVFAPAKPTPMPKRTAMPDYDDEDGEDAEA